MTTPDASEAWVDAIFNAVLSDVLASGWFDRANTHEPKNVTGLGLTSAIWVQDIRGVQVSGLAATSALLVFNVRNYTSMTSEPQDAIDPNLLKATSALMRRWNDNYDFGLDPLVRNVDLLGQLGTPLSARAGYVEISGKMHRVMTITLPVLVNDLWTQGGA